ncbi:MAG: acyl-CoA reductase [Flavobacteriales bacterium]|nr:acyl-CoA reductase [Flavobacteriales bacterium]
MQEPAPEKHEGGDVREATMASANQLGRLFDLVGRAVKWPGFGCGLSEAEYDEFDATVVRAYHRNGWFTEEQVRHALRALSSMLSEEELRSWCDRHPLPRDARPGSRIGLITAGNVPLVGFHDLLAVLLSGHQAHVKVSGQDAGLLQAVTTIWGCYYQDLRDRVVFREQELGTVDAVIATGSTNTARYFEHYFGHLPRIIRRNRVSVAVLDGTESEAELIALGEDVFRYYGLGCRNVAQLYLPTTMDTDRLFRAFYDHRHVVEHNKYANNYDYHRALWLLEGIPFLDNGFVLLKEDRSLNSPTGTLFICRYDDPVEVERELAAHEDRIQCVVGHGWIPFGRSQYPTVQDHADGVDTLGFLMGLYSTNS